MIMSWLSNSSIRLVKIVKKFLKSWNSFSSNTSLDYFPKISVYILLILILLLSYLYNYHEILFLRPQGIHQWRQCDCLSITMNYYQDNNPFFEPALHFLGDGTGKAMGEFPLIYYTVAQLWKIFGPHEFIYRLLNLMIFFTGLLALMKLTEHLLKDSIWAISVALILFSSPNIVFYANNFPVNVPAFGLAMIAWYFFWLFYKTGKSIYLWISLGIFTLGGLLKITSAVSFIAISILFLSEMTGFLKLKNDNRLFIKPFIQIIPFIILAGLIVSWYFYVIYYNKNYNQYLFQVGLLPIWDLDKIQIHEIFNDFKEQIKRSYFHLSMHIFVLTAFVIVLLSPGKANRFLYFLTVILSIGTILFIILFFRALGIHDYHFIDFFIHIPVIIITLLILLKKHYTFVFKSILFRLIVGALIIYNVGFTIDRMKERYTGWMNESYQVYMHRFEHITPFLRSLGIGPEDKVLCLPDQSPDISLYFMNQKGWTNYSTDLDSAKIIGKINQGADYLFIYIDTLYNNKNITPFIKDKIGEYNDIDIYDISGFRDQ